MTTGVGPWVRKFGQLFFWYWAGVVIVWWSRKTQHTKTYAPRPTRLHPARTVPLLRHSDLPPLGSEYGRSNEDEQSGSSERPAPPRSSRWRETRQASQSEGTLRKVQRSIRQIPSVRKGREETPRGFFFGTRVGSLNDRTLVKNFVYKRLKIV